MPEDTPVIDYRKITDALAGALDRLASKRAVVDTAATALAKANEEFEAAKTAAEQVRHKLNEHLGEVLPTPNRRP